MFPTSTIYQLLAPLHWTYSFQITLISWWPFSRPLLWRPAENSVNATIISLVKHFIIVASETLNKCFLSPTHLYLLKLLPPLESELGIMEGFFLNMGLYLVLFFLPQPLHHISPAVITFMPVAVSFSRLVIPNPNCLLFSTIWADP